MWVFVYVSVWFPSQTIFSENGVLENVFFLIKFIINLEHGVCQLHYKKEILKYRDS